MRSSLLIWLLICPSMLFSQSRIQQQIDSLLQVSRTAEDSTKLAILNRVGFHYVFNDLPKARTYIDSALQIAETKEHHYWRSALHNTYGIYMDISGKSDSAKFYFTRAMDIAQNYEVDIIYSNALNNLGMFHWNRSEYKEALEKFFKSLEMSKKLEGEEGTTASLSNIGLVYQDMKLYDKALEYHEQALQIRRKYNLLTQLPISLNNMAITLKSLGRKEEALQFANEASEVAENQRMTREYLSALNTQGTLLFEMGLLNEAKEKFETGILKRNELNIDRKSNLHYISNLIAIYNEQNDIKNAQRYVSMGQELLLEFPEIEKSAVDYYKHATKTAYASGNNKQGALFFEKTLASKDSLFSNKNAEEIALLETQFNVAEKERDLAQTRANLAEKELEVRRKNTLVYGGFGLAVLLGLLGYLFYNQQKLKNNQLRKEGELKSALARIETQNKLQEQRLRISRDLHDNIGSQLTFVASSVDSLQYGMEKKDTETANKLGNISAFTTQTIYQLRDTIWAMNKTEITAEDLQVRIANFMDKADKARDDINFNFKTDPSLLDKKFTSIQGMNIYRIIQEAVNNALKYAQATVVSVVMEPNNGKENNVKVTISDNGVGFNEADIEAGNGLLNMKKRAKELGGSLTIKSNKDTGTTISVLL